MARDRWAEWVLERRFAGAPRHPTVAYLAGIRDEVLDRAGMAGGETVLDVGCGDGLIGFGALQRGAGQVVFCDISQELLDVCAGIAADLGVTDRCRFLAAPAQDLTGVAEGSVDVVTTRSVLIYVADKAAAFAEFHRALAPGGRISLFEPINSLSGRRSRPDALWGYELPGMEPLIARVQAVFENLQPPETDPMLNFTERDLAYSAEHAGFTTIELRFTLQINPATPMPWETYRNIAPNPNVPTLGEAIEQALAPGECTELTSRLRPLVEQGSGRRRSGYAYLSATKQRT